MINKQSVELLINSAGKRTVVLLNPSFFYFFNPSYVIRNKLAPVELRTDCKKRTDNKYNATTLRNFTTILFLTSLFFNGNVFGQAKDTIPITHKHEKYYLTKTCFATLKWDEVVIKNKTVANKINSAIRTAVYSYKLSSDDTGSWCNQTMEYEPEFNAVYAKHNLVSYSLTAYTHFNDAPHGDRQFSTLNFNATTGERITFHDLIDSNKISAVDTLIIQKLTDRLKGIDTDMDSWKKQLPYLEFNIGNNGIEILFRGEVYADSIIEVMLTKEDLKPFIDKDGILKNYYANKI